MWHWNGRLFSLCSILWKSAEKENRMKLRIQNINFSHQYQQFTFLHGSVILKKHCHQTPAMWFQCHQWSINVTSANEFQVHFFIVNLKIELFVSMYYLELSKYCILYFSLSFNSNNNCGYWSYFKAQLLSLPLHCILRKTNRN